MMVSKFIQCYRVSWALAKLLAQAHLCLSLCSAAEDRSPGTEAENPEPINTVWCIQGETTQAPRGLGGLRTDITLRNETWCYGK